MDVQYYIAVFSILCSPDAGFCLSCYFDGRPKPQICKSVNPVCIITSKNKRYCDNGDNHPTRPQYEEADGITVYICASNGCNKDKSTILDEPTTTISTTQMKKTTKKSIIFPTAIQTTKIATAEGSRTKVTLTTATQKSMSDITQKSMPDIEKSTNSILRCYVGSKTDLEDCKVQNPVCVITNKDERSCDSRDNYATWPWYEGEDGLLVYTCTTNGCNKEISTLDEPTTKKPTTQTEEIKTKIDVLRCYVGDQTNLEDCKTDNPVCIITSKDERYCDNGNNYQSHERVCPSEGEGGVIKCACNTTGCNKEMPTIGDETTSKISTTQMKGTTKNSIIFPTALKTTKVTVTTSTQTSTSMISSTKMSTESITTLTSSTQKSTLMMSTTETSTKSITTSRTSTEKSTTTMSAPGTSTESRTTVTILTTLTQKSTQMIPTTKTSRITTMTTSPQTSTLMTSAPETTRKSILRCYVGSKTHLEDCKAHNAVCVITNKDKMYCDSRDNFPTWPWYEGKDGLLVYTCTTNGCNKEIFALDEPTTTTPTTQTEEITEKDVLRCYVGTQTSLEDCTTDNPVCLITSMDERYCDTGNNYVTNGEDCPGESQGGVTKCACDTNGCNKDRDKAWLVTDIQNGSGSLYQVLVFLYLFCITFCQTCGSILHYL